MSTTSLNFFFYLIPLLAVYYALRHRLQNYWLLCVSDAFYTSWKYPVIRYRRILIALPIFLAILAWVWLERRHADEVFFLRGSQWLQALVLAFFLFVLGFLMQTKQLEPFIYQRF